jgi:hypothetical protein
MPYFDMEHLEKAIDENNLRSSLLTEALLENFVLDQKSFATLAVDLQRKLSAGLNLEKRASISRGEGGGLLDAQGNPLDPNRKRPLILPNDPQQKANPAAALQVKPELEAKPAIIVDKKSLAGGMQTDWPQLNARWRKLPLAERQAAIRISQLDPLLQARLVTNLPVESKSPKALANYLHVDSTKAPAWLKRLRLSLDGKPGRRPLELALDRPKKDIAGAFAIVDQIFQETHLQTTQSAPHLQRRIDSAFHLHLGLLPSAPLALKRKLKHALLEYKRLLAIRLLASGPDYDGILYPQEPGLPRVSETPYDYQLEDSPLREGKGLVRLVDSDHAELRQLTSSPKAAFQEFNGLMAMDPADATKNVDAEVKKLFARDPSIVKRIEQINPGILFEFSD